MTVQKNPNDWVTIQNIDSEPHQVVYDSKLWTTIAPNATKSLPRYIAEHAVKHLIDHMLNKKGLATNLVTARENLARQIVLGEQTFETVEEQSEYDRVRDEIDKRSMSDIDLAALPQANPVPVEPIPPAPVDLPPAVPQQAPVEAVVEKVEESAPVVEETKWVENPDRETIYRYATEVLKVDMDEKTKKAFDEIELADLIKELNYEAS